MPGVVRVAQTGGCVSEVFVAISKISLLKKVGEVSWSVGDEIIVNCPAEKLEFQI